MKRLLLTLLLVLPLVAARAQGYSTTNGKAIKLYERGQEALYQGDAAAALRLMAQAIEAEPAFVEPHLVLAEWHHDARDYAKAKEHYYDDVDLNA